MDHMDMHMPHMDMGILAWKMEDGARYCTAVADPHASRA